MFALSTASTSLALLVLTGGATAQPVVHWDNAGFALCPRYPITPHARSLTASRTGCEAAPVQGRYQTDADEDEAGGALARFNLVWSDQYVDPAFPNALVTAVDALHVLHYRRDLRSDYAVVPARAAAATEVSIRNPHPGQSYRVDVWLYERVRLDSVWPNVSCATGAGDLHLVTATVSGTGLGGGSCYRTCSCTPPPLEVTAGRWRLLHRLDFSAASFGFSWLYGVGAGAFLAPRATSGHDYWARTHTVLALAVVDAGASPPALALPPSPPPCGAALGVSAQVGPGGTLPWRVTTRPGGAFSMLLGAGQAAATGTPCGALRLDPGLPIVVLASGQLKAPAAVGRGTLTIPATTALVGSGFFLQGVDTGACGCGTSLVAGVAIL